MRNYHVEGFDRFRGAWQRLCRRWSTLRRAGHSARPVGKVSLRCEALEKRETPNDLLGCHLGSVLGLGGLVGPNARFAFSPLPSGNDERSPVDEDPRAGSDGPVNRDQPPAGQGTVLLAAPGRPASERANTALAATEERGRAVAPSSLNTAPWEDPLADLFAAARGQLDTSRGLRIDQPDQAGAEARSSAAGVAASDPASLHPGSDLSGPGPAAPTDSAFRAQQNALLRAAATGRSLGGPGTPPPPSLGDTTTNINASAEPATPGQLVTYTAIVQVASPGTSIPTGQVLFSGAAQYPTLADLTWYGGPDGYGIATVQWQAPTEPCYFWIDARYQGDDNYNPSEGTDLQVVKDPPPIPPSSGCSCNNQPGDLLQETPSNNGNMPPGNTSGGVRASDGVVQVTAPDLSSDGFGIPWGQTRSWSNGGYGSGNGNGSGWVGTQTPSLLRVDGTTTDTLAVISNGTTSRYFDQQGEGYQSRYFVQDTLSYDAGNHQYLLTDTQGDQVRFSDFSPDLPAAQQGQLSTYTDPGGNVTQVTSRTSTGQVQEVQRGTQSGGSTVTESYRHDYLPRTDPNAGLLQDTILRRQIDGGSWSIVRQVVYTYYSPLDRFNNGNPGDLKTATIEDAAGTALDVYYYRYYTPGDLNGIQHALKYTFGPQSYGRLVGAVGDPTQASNEAVAPYADNYLQYDSQLRVTLDVVQGQGCSSCTGGLGAYTYQYTTSANPAGANSWAEKTVEGLPDGNQNVLYTNAYGEVMLADFHDTTRAQDWPTFYQYDDQGRVALQADPAAVTGYDDSHADLLVRQGSSYQYLSNNSGKLTRYDYYGTTTAAETTPGGVAGYQQDTALQRGQQGTPVLQDRWQYYAHTGGGSTVYPAASDTVYRNETSDPNDPGAETTRYAYTWFPGSTRMQTMTIDKPIVSAAENGPGTADREVYTYDAQGRMAAHTDGDGHVTTTAYDQATSAVTRRVGDAGGLNLTTTTQVDALGRAVKSTDPDGHVTYTVYDDADHEVRTYSGWDSATGRPTGPTEVSREDRLGGYTETLTTSDQPHLNSANQPDGTEQITAANLRTLSRGYTNAAGQMVRRDAYRAFDGMDYSTDLYLGSPDVNYYTTRYSYDQRGRQDRITSPTGTILQTDYDGLGRSVDVQVGTVGTSMTMVSQYHYDQATPGGPDGVGDGNQTAMVQLPGGGAASRETDYYYDWRDRQVASKEGVQANEDTTTHRPILYTEYDNRGEATAQERYDGDRVTITTTNGVPRKPAPSLRRSRMETRYDEQGRVYRTLEYNVSPTDGTLLSGGNASRTDTWYDHRGEVLELAEPGGLVTRTQYDGAGRATTTYRTDGLDNSTWADASSVTNNDVLSQTQTRYDANGNALLVTTRDRFHDETRTGALGGPNSTDAPRARVSYRASYYDQADRLTTRVDVGTNAGLSYTRPDSVPGRSDTVLVTGYVYDAAGRVQDVIDPRGLDTRMVYDALDRVTRQVQDYTDGVVTNDSNNTTDYTYDGANHVLTLTAEQPAGTPAQTTQFVYGVSSTTGSALNSNDLLAATLFPDPMTGLPSTDQQETRTYDALGQTTTFTDRNGNVHTDAYDVLGRPTADAVTTLGDGIDGAVQRIETAYDTQGNASLLTSYDAASGGNVVNQALRQYNGLEQLTAEFQAATGAVNTATTPVVRYSYSEMAGGRNNSRLTSLTYPNGRVVNYSYAAGLDDRISRLTSMSDSSGILESYRYLGLDLVVERDHPRSGVNQTYIGSGGGDGGDQYVGLDRFGRVVDQQWTRGGGPATDEFRYTYDRDGNVLTRGNVVNPLFSETYSYDDLNRLTAFQRQNGYTRSWVLDAQGNFRSVTTDGVPENRQHNAQNQITSISPPSTTPGYDRNGNTTADDQGHVLVYDAWNRLVAVKDSGGAVLAAYRYDGLDYRVGVTEGGATTDLYYSSNWQVLEERSGGRVQAQNVWSLVYVDALVLRDQNPDAGGQLTQRLTVQQDANWNVTSLVGLVNTTWSVVERYVYDPYGQATVLDPVTWQVRGGGAQGTSSFGWVYLHQGGRYDTTNALYYFRYRDYSPTLGRWMQQDPIEYAAGDRNLYRFVENDPTHFTDPLGLYIPMRILVSFRDDTVTEIAYQWQDSFGGFNVSISAKDVPDMVGKIKKAQAELEQNKAWMPKGFKRVRNTVLIKAIEITGHGNPGQWAGKDGESPRLTGEELDEKSGDYSAEKTKKLAELKPIWAKENDGVTMRMCLTARGDEGKKFLKLLAQTLGANVLGWDGIYEIRPTGAEFTATPNGTVTQTGHTGRASIVEMNRNVLDKVGPVGWVPIVITSPVTWGLRLLGF